MLHMVHLEKCHIWTAKGTHQGYRWRFPYAVKYDSLFLAVSSFQNKKTCRLHIDRGTSTKKGTQGTHGPKKGTHRERKGTRQERKEYIERGKLPM